MAEEENSSSDESIDPTSEKFDPIRALYSSRLLVPVPDAPTYDNLSKYENVLKGITSSKSKVRTSTELQTGTRETHSYHIFVISNRLYRRTGNHAMRVRVENFCHTSVSIHWISYCYCPVAAESELLD